MKLLGIKDEFEEEWNRIWDKYKSDPYNWSAMNGAVKIAKAIEDGKSFEEAISEAKKKDERGQYISLNNCSRAVYLVVRYHKKGEAFREWWHKTFFPGRKVGEHKILSAERLDVIFNQ